MGFDKDSLKIKKLNKQIIPIKEPNLNLAIKTASKKNLRFSNNLEISEIYIICFGTDNHSFNIDNNNLFNFAINYQS